MYVAEILLLEYCKHGSYPNPKNGYPGFWWFEYGIQDVDAVLESLKSRGFLRAENVTEALRHLTVPELKRIMADIGLKSSGRKADLITKIIENTREDDLEKRVPIRHFSLTELGIQEVEENGYVKYLHNKANSCVSVWRMNKLVRDHPDVHWRDLLWAEYNRLLLRYSQNIQYGYYRNIRFQMFEFSMEENQLELAFTCLSEIVYIDLNTPYLAHLRLDMLIAPNIKKNLFAVSQKLNYDENSTFKELMKAFKEIHLDQQQFTIAESAAIVTAYIFDDEEKAEFIFNNVKKDST